MKSRFATILISGGLLMTASATTINAACGGFVLWTKQVTPAGTAAFKVFWSPESGYDTASACETERKKAPNPGPMKDSQGKFEVLITFHCFPSDFDPRPKS